MTRISSGICFRATIHAAVNVLLVGPDLERKILNLVCEGRSDQYPILKFACGLV
jgi:hypothetical protein